MAGKRSTSSSHRRRSASRRRDGASRSRSARSAGGRPVIIVESPSKARTIERIVSGRYVVCSSMGHVRDLPPRRFGIDIEKGFEPTYVPIRGRAQVLRELRKVVRGAPEVFLAPDPDREGEAIAWHLAQALEIPPERLRRVTFHEITRRAVEEAFARPRGISMPLVEAQQARRLLDRIVGYKLSPLLWKKVGRGLSAGRVQSVAVRLIVEREREIQNFRPAEYWRLTATLAPRDGGPTFQAELHQIQGQPPPQDEPLIQTGQQAEALRREFEPGPWIVQDVERRERTERAPPPFTTSLVQQQASIRLHFSTKRTMAVAQQLYEGIELGKEGRVGLITYMRTDSFRVADEAVQACRQFVGSTFGPEYLPPRPPVRAAGKHAQEAHEAIRPTDVGHTPESLQPYLTPDQFKLYRLIWRRFVASQMSPARFQVTEIRVRSGRGIFRAVGRILRFDGYTRVWPARDREEPVLPDVAPGTELDLEKLEATQHFTEPPPRYSEAMLVKTLEKYGIGRPSTYAPIIATIQERGYVQLENRRFVPTPLGVLVTDKLVRHFADIMDTGFTARMEKNLDRIEQARADWRQVLWEFHKIFVRDLERAQADMASEKQTPAEGEPPCEKCGRPMVWRWNRFGRFLGCSGFPECDGRRAPQDEIAPEPCAWCGGQLLVRRNRWGRYLACANRPPCSYTRPLEYRGRPLRIPNQWAETCPQSSHRLIVRLGRRGPFIACTGYPDCRHTTNLPREWTRAAPANES